MFTWRNNFVYLGDGDSLTRIELPYAVVQDWDVDELGYESSECFWFCGDPEKRRFRGLTWRDSKSGLPDIAPGEIWADVDIEINKCELIPENSTTPTGIIRSLSGRFDGYLGSGWFEAVVEVLQVFDDGNFAVGVDGIDTAWCFREPKLVTNPGNRLRIDGYFMLNGGLDFDRIRGCFDIDGFPVDISGFPDNMLSLW